MNFGSLPRAGDLIKIKIAGKTLSAKVEAVTAYRVIARTLGDGESRTVFRPHHSNVWRWDYSR